MKTILFSPRCEMDVKKFSQWELFLDEPSQKYLLFGHVWQKEFATRPTKRQVRQFKRQFRKATAKLIERSKWNDSWEAIHCDIIGL